MQTAKVGRARGRPRAIGMQDGPSKAEMILDSAVAAFALHGFDGASMRQIASEAGVDAALLVHKFGSKLELWQAAVDDVAAKLLAAIGDIAVETATDHADPAVRLSAATDRMIDLVCDTPRIAQFVLKEIVQQDARFEYIFDKLVRPMHDLLIPLIGAVGDPDEGDGVDPDFRFFAFAGAVVTTVVSRPFMMRMSLPAVSEPIFRAELKRAAGAQLARLRR